MNPLILGALIQNIAAPELARWLASIHAEGRVVTEADALAKLELDADPAIASGLAFVKAHT